MVCVGLSAVHQIDQNVQTQILEGKVLAACPSTCHPLQNTDHCPTVMADLRERGGYVVCTCSYIQAHWLLPSSGTPLVVISIQSSEILFFLFISYFNEATHP